jgi:hypothetical protein
VIKSQEIVSFDRHRTGTLEEQLGIYAAKPTVNSSNLVNASNYNSVNQIHWLVDDFVSDFSKNTSKPIVQKNKSKT